MVTDLIIDRHPSAVVSVSGMVADGSGRWLCTLRIVPDECGITDADAAEWWREHVADIGAWPV